MNREKTTKILRELDTISKLSVDMSTFDRQMKTLKRHMLEYGFEFYGRSFEKYAAEFKFYYVPTLKSIIETICEDERLTKNFTEGYAFDLYVGDKKFEIRPATYWNSYSNGFYAYDFKAKKTIHFPKSLL